MQFVILTTFRAYEFELLIIQLTAFSIFISDLIAAIITASTRIPFELINVVVNVFSFFRNEDLK